MSTKRPSSSSGPTGPALPTPGPSIPVHSQPYYSNLSSWQTNWTSAGGYPYSTGYQPSQPYPQAAFVPYQPQGYAPAYNPVPTSKPKTPPPHLPASSPSPPPPETYRHWDQVIHAFLTRLGLTQAAAGFEADMLVMNPTWEQHNVPDALAELTKHISLLGKDNNEIDSETKERPLEERKLDYVHLASDVPPRSQSTINKEISRFLAQNRARNDASNRAEFVYTLAQKRQRLAGADEEPAPSCARTDAKPLDRDVQMKYDIARNDEGPLSRTMHTSGAKNVDNKDNKGKGKARTEGEGALLNPGVEDEAIWTAERHPGLDERLRNIETHLAVRYVPAPPRTLLARLKFLEEHLIRLEKDYPPWAALHFNQPNRGWPPPPRQTPIIVPPHMRDVPGKDALNAPTGAEDWLFGEGRPRNTKSSLHRAVLERLEVKQAMSDLARGRG